MLCKHEVVGSIPSGSTILRMGSRRRNTSFVVGVTPAAESDLGHRERGFVRALRRRRLRRRMDLEDISLARSARPRPCVLRSSDRGAVLTVHERKLIDQATQEHSMDALAVRGDEGRGTLR